VLANNTRLVAMARVVVRFEEVMMARMVLDMTASVKSSLSRKLLDSGKDPPLQSAGQKA
jgi:hypothetical protein